MATTPGHERETYLGEALGSPEVRYLGWERQRAARRSLGPHIHKGAYELCYIVAGQVDWWAEDDIYEVPAGSIYFTRPHEQHGGVDGIMHPCEIYWTIVSFPTRGPMTGLTSGETRRLRQAFARLRHRRFKGSDKLRDHFAHLHQTLRAGGELSPLAARAMLHAILVEVIHCHDAHRDEAGGMSPVIRRAAAWMEQHVAEDYRIDDLADHAGMGISQFHLRFRREVGVTPADHRTRLRIRLAKRLLRDPKLSITDVAMQCGFSTSQYFATTFRRMTGLKPGECRGRAETVGS